MPPDARAKHAALKAITRHAANLLSGTAHLGGTEDLQLETRLREMWGLSPEDGAYINGEFSDLPSGQALNDLFPKGRPKRRVKAPA